MRSLSMMSQSRMLLEVTGILLFQLLHSDILDLFSSTIIRKFHAGIKQKQIHNSVKHPHRYIQVSGGVPAQYVAGYRYIHLINKNEFHPRITLIIYIMQN